MSRRCNSDSTFASSNPAAPTSNAPVSPQHSKPSLKKPKLPATASSPSSPSSSSQANVDIRSHRTTRSVSSSPDAEEEEESPLKLTKVAPGTYKWTSDEGASKATKKSVPTFAYDSQDRFTPGSAVLAKFGDTGSWPAVVSGSLSVFVFPSAHHIVASSPRRRCSIARPLRLLPTPTKSPENVRKMRTC